MDNEPEQQELPLKDVVITDIGFDLQEHHWTQRGNYIECPGNCRWGYLHGHHLKDGLQINKNDKGEWYIEKLY